MKNKPLDKFIEVIKSLKEDAAPTNNVGSGAIAGTVEAGDDPPVRKKKRYNNIIPTIHTRPPHI